MTNEDIVLRIQAGEDVQKNIEQLYIENIGLLKKAASRFYIKSDECEDLEQTGFFGLIKAAERWRPDGGASFSSYAYIKILREMQQYIESSGSCFRIPKHRQEKISQLRKAYTQFCSDRGRDPDDSELAELLGITKEKLEEIRMDAEMLRIRSTSERIRVGEDELELEDTLPDHSIEDTDERMQRDELNEVLWNIVDELPGRAPEVIRKRYQDEKSARDCAVIMGITPAEVGIIHHKAIMRMRSYKIRNRLEEFYSPDNLAALSLRHVGVKRYGRDRTSSVENAILLGDELRNND